MKRLRHLVGATDGLDGDVRADRIVQGLTGLSRRELRGLFDHACVTLDGVICDRPEARLRHGAAIDVAFDPGRRYPEKPRPPSIPGTDLLHLDEAIVVVDKPWRALTVPTANGEPRTLVEIVRVALRQREPLGVVQRLDRGVSGVLVFGRTRAATASLRGQFEERHPEREYVAVVSGEPRDDHFTIRSRLVTTENLGRRVASHEEPGEHAITHVTVRERWGDSSLLSVRLETGKRHQIRVHLADRGHSILGDDRYGEMHPRWHERRIALHALTLEIEHPTTAAKMRFESPIPSAFRLGPGRAPTRHTARETAGETARRTSPEPSRRPDQSRTTSTKATTQAKVTIPSKPLKPAKPAKPANPAKAAKSAAATHPPRKSRRPTGSIPQKATGAPRDAGAAGDTPRSAITRRAGAYAAGRGGSAGRSDGPRRGSPDRA